MSTFSAPSNRLLVLIAALVLGWTTTLPWYAPSAQDPTTTDGPVEQAAWHVARLFQDVAGARTGTDGLLLVVAGVVALLAAGLMAAPSQPLGDVLRLAGLAPLVLVLIAAVTPPRGFGIHYGLLAGGVAAAVLANAALHGGVVRVRPGAPVR